jgi:hypothetical protein
MVTRCINMDGALQCTVNHYVQKSITKESYSWIWYAASTIILSKFYAWKYEYDFCIIGAEHFLHMSIDYRTQIHRYRRGPINNLEIWKFIQIKLTKNDTDCTLHQHKVWVHGQMGVHDIPYIAKQILRMSMLVCTTQVRNNRTTAARRCSITTTTKEK